jgi:ATP-dependent helicase HrpB
MSKQTLPIDSFLPAIVHAVSKHASVIVMAEPGAGKTTRVPVALSNADLSKWIVLQPRRWAARLTATRIAEENQWQLGQEVGYQIRFESRASKKTRILFMTEGVLLRLLAGDPELHGYAGVILDEFHERSLDLDLSLALLKEIQESLRPDFKIVIMSATLDPKPLEVYLPDSKSFAIPGRTFPVEKRYLPLLANARDIDLIPALRMILNEQASGDILIFLPGSREIERACDEIRGFLRGNHDFEVLPLYANLTDADQKRVFEPSPKRKIICSTNIAETSITLPNVKAVIDSGLSRVMRMDPQFGMDRLETVRISRASSEQRAGRAGRVSAGICVRLWSEHEQTALRHFETAEIHRVNLSRALLLLCEFGVSNFKNFSWFEAPKSSMLNFSVSELESLGFLQENKMTDAGKLALKLPLEPRLAAVVLQSEKHHHPEFGARFAAFLENLTPRDSIRDEDVFLRRLNHLTPVEMRSALQILPGPRENARAAPDVSANPNTIAPTNTRTFLRELNPANWPDYARILIESGKTRIVINGRMVGRRKVSLRDGNLPEAFLILSALEKNEIQVTSFVPLPKAIVLEYARKKREVFWDEAAARVKGVEGLFFEDLELGNLTDVPVTPEEAAKTLQAMILKNPEAILSRNEEFAEFLKRVRFFNSERSVGEQKIELPWEDLISAIVMDKTRLSDVLQSGIVGTVEGLLDAALFSELEREAPMKVQVPSGSFIRIDYDSDPPKVSVRLQEVFGWLDTPKIANGRVALLLELLSPGFKPMQMTKDLKSFWKGTYFEVKKELKARYPKHAWPEDPLTAKPEAKGRRRF